MVWTAGYISTKCEGFFCKITENGPIWSGRSDGRELRATWPRWLAFFWCTNRIKEIIRSSKQSSPTSVPLLLWPASLSLGLELCPLPCLVLNSSLLHLDCSAKLETSLPPRSCNPIVSQLSTECCFILSTERVVVSQYPPRRLGPHDKAPCAELQNFRWRRESHFRLRQAVGAAF